MAGEVDVNEAAGGAVGELKVLDDSGNRADVMLNRVESLIGPGGAVAAVVDGLFADALKGNAPCLPKDGRVPGYMALGATRNNMGGGDERGDVQGNDLSVELRVVSVSDDAAGLEGGKLEDGG